MHESTEVGMKTEHRQAITRNFKNLVDNCNIDLLIPELLRRNVFSKQMITKYMETDKTENARKLFLDILRRGPDAFSNLIESLEATGHGRLAQDLCSGTKSTNKVVVKPVPPIHGAVPFKLPSNPPMSPENVQLMRQLSSQTSDDFDILDISVKPSTTFHIGDPRLPTYSTFSKQRGHALIINNICFEKDQRRQGAERDGDYLKDLFQQIGLTVIYHQDKTACDIKEIIKGFTKDPDLESCDMAVLVISSHGDQTLYNECYLKGTDGDKVETTFIEKLFSNVDCPFLKDKPKILIYQICRGDKNDYVEKDRISDDALPNFSPPIFQDGRTYSDMLIAHSTLPGYQSHRDIYAGSWYIQKMCKVFMEHAHDTSVDNLFKMVDCELRRLQSGYGTMQTSTYQSVGFNTCFFHPGIYRDENNEIKHF